MHARAGTEIDDVIGAAHRFFVVLDHQQRIAAIFSNSSACSRCSLSRGVQADGRFIQNVEHAAEIRAELRRQTNALGFAAGQAW